MNIDELSYEEAQEKLKELLDKMENNELTLDESIKDFKLASSLYEHCSKLLMDAEGKIKVILDEKEDIEGEFSLEV